MDLNTRFGNLHSRLQRSCVGLVLPGSCGQELSSRTAIHPVASHVWCSDIALDLVLSKKEEQVGKVEKNEGEEEQVEEEQGLDASRFQERCDTSGGCWARWAEIVRGSGGSRSNDWPLEIIIRNKYLIQSGFVQSGVQCKNFGC